VRILWQAFTSREASTAFVGRLESYLDQIADPGTEFHWSGLAVADRHLHRLTELRCAAQAIRQVIEAEQSYDAVVMGHFQDPGLWEARAALDVPVVGLGEASLLYACQLGWAFGLITIHPTFVRWHQEQVRRYGLEQRLVGVRAMETPPDLFARAFEDEAVRDEVRRQFEEQAQPLLDAGVEVIIPAGGFPALLFGRDETLVLDGAVVLNPIAVAAKQVEAAIKLRRLNGTGPSRRSTFMKPSADAVREYLEQIST
jgi:allantoin racemase